MTSNISKGKSSSSDAERAVSPSPQTAVAVAWVVNGAHVPNRGANHISAFEQTHTVTKFNRRNQPRKNKKHVCSLENDASCLHNMTLVVCIKVIKQKTNVTLHC